MIIQCSNALQTANIEQIDGRMWNGTLYFLPQIIMQLNTYDYILWNNGSLASIMWCPRHIEISGWITSALYKGIKEIWKYEENCPYALTKQLYEH